MSNIAEEQADSFTRSTHNVLKNAEEPPLEYFAMLSFLVGTEFHFSALEEHCDIVDSVDVVVGFLEHRSKSLPTKEKGFVIIVAVYDSTKPCIRMYTSSRQHDAYREMAIKIVDDVLTPGEVSRVNDNTYPFLSRQVFH